jgi:hypothetical protein
MHKAAPLMVMGKLLHDDVCILASCPGGALRRVQAWLLDAVLQLRTCAWERHSQQHLLHQDVVLLQRLVLAAVTACEAARYGVAGTHAWHCKCVVHIVRWMHVSGVARQLACM